MSKLTIPTAEVFEPLIEPARYKGAYGGRGSGKSWFFGGLGIDRCLERGTRMVCIREVQKSLRDSAKRLIEDQLKNLGLGERHGFKVWKELIETPGDGVILFQGMQDHTAESIKSLEGFDIAWCEEAQTMSAHSLRLLRPTIRGDDSELWFSWNPRRKADPVDMMFRQGKAPTNSAVVQANWCDNPWFPDVLEQERQDCLRDTPEEYDHIWQGGYATITQGAYYAKHLAEARSEGRIGVVPADPLLTLRVFVDIGGTGAKADNFVMWVAQFVGQQILWLDYYEAQGQDLAAHLTWLRSKGYTPDRAQIWLPHDGASNDKVYDVSYESALRGAGYTVTVVPNQGKGAAMKRVEEMRRLFPRMWFNEETTSGGIDALGWYHEKIDPARQIGLGPDHDWASHGSDAAGLGAIVWAPPKAAPKKINFKGI